MASLKNRQSQIPNGLKFALPEVGYQSAPFTSFDTILNQVDNIVRANPGKAKAAGWPTDRTEIATWIDDFNARICIQNGWLNYVNIQAGEDPLPKHGPPPGRPDGAAVAGARAIVEWTLDGAVPVESSTATNRAAVCVGCPLNTPGDLTNFFERATSEMLRKQISAFRDEKLATPHDNHLGVCSACSCPMRLKVHFPLKYITKHMLKESYDALHQDCWVRAESGNGQETTEKGPVQDVASTGIQGGAPPPVS